MENGLFQNFLYGNIFPPKVFYLRLFGCPPLTSPL